jgi:superoxide dismutase
MASTSHAVSDAHLVPLPSTANRQPQKRFKLVADGHFGSGWSWVCASGDGGLRILDTANQDNPLMGVSWLAFVSFRVVVAG